MEVRVLAVLLLFYFISSKVNAQAFYINTNVAVSGNGTLASPFKTIQMGFTQLQNQAGNTLNIAAGTYSGTGNYDLDLVNVNNTFIYGAGSSSTIIDCQNNGIGITSSGGTVLVISGLTIKNCKAQIPPVNGGAINVQSTSTVTLLDVKLINNYATANGGGIYLFNTLANFSSVNLQGNSAGGSGGGIYTWGYSVVTIGGSSSFNSNSAPQGTNLYCSTGSVALNIASNAGVCSSTSCNLTQNGNTITPSCGNTGYHLKLSFTLFALLMFMFIIIL